MARGCSCRSTPWLCRSACCCMSRPPPCLSSRRSDGRSLLFFFFSSRRRHTRFDCDWSSDVCSSDLPHDDLRRGALDMGVTACRDPYSSPYSPAGQLCAVAPLRCLECRNAWILPSHLPQLLLFSDFLDRLRLRLPPAQFTALWGQAFVNLRSEEHTSELQSQSNLVCRLLLEKKK